MCWNIAPFLGHGLDYPPWVSLGFLADLLGHVHTLLDRSQLGHQLGHVLAGTLGLERALLLGGVLDDGLGLVEALLGALLEAAAGGSAELAGLLGATGDGGVLLHGLLGHAADLNTER